MEVWTQDLAERRDGARFEIEPWFRDSPDRQRAAGDVARVPVEGAGGRVVKSARTARIRYQALLAELPPAGVRELLDRIGDDTHTAMLRCERVMFFRPRPQTSFAVPADDPEPAGDAEPAGPVADAAGEPTPEDDPVVPLLDGVPLQKHLALDGRIVLDDPDGRESSVEAEHRSHVTATASLIVHGDLNDRDRGGALPSKIHVRPVLTPQRADTQSGFAGQFPPDRLMVDLIHEAVVRTKGGRTRPRRP